MHTKLQNPQIIQQRSLLCGIDCSTPACLEEMPLAHSNAKLKIFGYHYFIYLASGAKQIR